MPGSFPQPTLLTLHSAVLCKKAVATKSRDEEGIMAHPDRIPLAQAFETFTQEREEVLHFALHSAFAIGQPPPTGDLHLTHVAVGLFHCNNPEASAPKFDFLGLRMLEHAEYYAEKLSALEKDDPNRIRQEALLSQKGLNEYWEFSEAAPSMARCAAVWELSDTPLPPAGSEFSFVAVCQIAHPFVIDLRDFPDSPQFPVDNDWLQHLDEDLRNPKPIATRAEMREHQLKRLGSAGSNWVNATEAWVAKKEAEMPEVSET
ncbi:hypothetical protein P7C70_g4440, partial [Phenoliferia sp. Uapishka_3]